MSLRTVRIFLAVLSLTAAALAASQGAPVLRDVEGAIIDEVEQQVTESVEQRVTDAVEDSVTESVEESVTESVEQSVTDTVERQVTESIERSVSDSVEQQVTDSVEQSVAAAVEGQITDSVEETVTGAVEQQVTESVQRAVTERVEGRIVQGVERAVESDLLADRIELARDAPSESTVADVKAALSGMPRTRLDRRPETVKASLALRRPRPKTQASAAGESATKDILPPADEPFFEALDENGWPAERDTWVLLVPMVSEDEIDGWSLDIRERRTLSELDAVLLRVDAPSDRTLAGLARSVAASAPGTRVGRNHVYRMETPAVSSVRAEVQEDSAALQRAALEAEAPSRLGIIDSTVKRAHPALGRADIIERDFVSYSGRRPADHGTAVASLLVGDGEDVSGLLGPDTSLHVASVFFEDEFGVVRATSAGLIQALDWMRQKGVQVVNMSLTGPPNLLLEGALETAVASGMLVVAAVGNNGPTGEPLYPAAYQTVIGVTAVDADNQVYRLANRGPQVAFSALGVGVRVAAVDGGYRIEEGTSLASPVVAARLAQLSGSSPAMIIEALKALAIDLDPPGFNETYGFGLVAGSR